MIHSVPTMTILTPSDPPNVSQETIRDDAAAGPLLPRERLKKMFLFFEIVFFTKCDGGIKCGNFQIQWKIFGTTGNKRIFFNSCNESGKEFFFVRELDTGWLCEYLIKYDYISFTNY
jgi:hypothetical protein